MRQSKRIVFVSAGMLSPKKRDHMLARRQLYLNYGALTLATLLHSRGQPSVVVHGEHQDPESFLNRLESHGLIPTLPPLMLSLPSFYALSWAQEFCRILRGRYPETKIVAGGRWVTGPDPAWLKTLIPELDIVVPGLAEHAISDLAKGRWISSEAPWTHLPDFPLDHRHVIDFEAFQPSIEASRGCGMGCAFCEERAIRLTKLRSPAILAEFFHRTLEQYGGGEIRPYLQSSFFLPNVRWASELRKEMSARGMNVAWRCETRVDAMSPETVAHLAAAGMKVIDLGLETASPTQIRAMTKSPNVDRYLESASTLLAACKAHGVWAKVNVLLYAGETTQTFEETRAWLHSHAGAIKGVSVGPVIAFGPPKQVGSLLQDMSRYGARIVDTSSAAKTGITHLHLSSEIDAEIAEKLSLSLSREFMTSEDYFDLKSFSYYPRDYTKADFAMDVRASSQQQLPFMVAE